MSSVVDSRPADKLRSVPFLPIKDLTTWTTHWAIQARVIEKSQTSQFKRMDGESSQVGNVTLMDKQGDSIRAVFWGNAVNQWWPVIQEGKVFVLRGGSVRVANKRFSTVAHNYEIVFDNGAEIYEVTESSEGSEVKQSIPFHRKSNITKLRDIQHSAKSLPYMVDLCVILTWMSPEAVTVTTQGGSETLRRGITVCDDSEHKMGITLWNEWANNEALHQAYEQQADDTPVVLVLQNIQIRDYRGRTGANVRTSSLIVNPSDDKDADKLVEWYKNEGRHAALTSLTEDASQTRSGSQQATECTLSEAFDRLNSLPLANRSDPSDMVTVIAEPMKIHYTTRTGDLALSFPACRKCNRKCANDDGSFSCDKCGVVAPVERYMFRVSLVDASGARFLARFFDGPGHAIIGCSADAFRRWTPPPARLDTIAKEAKQILEYDCLWNRYRITLRMRKELYASEETKNVMAVAAAKINYTVDARRMLKEMSEWLPGYPAATKRVRKRENTEDSPNQQENDENDYPVKRPKSSF